VRIAFVNRSGRAVDASRYRAWLRRLASYLDAPSGTLTVLFCGDEEIAELNRAWRGKPRPTDVLSFEGGGATAEGKVHIGDLAISVETAARGARRAGHTLLREIEMLLAHGLLHLMGYDHETDDGTMMRLQVKALAAARAPMGGPRGGRSVRPSPPGLRGRRR
jgi:probable rRNA maturation factor